MKGTRKSIWHDAKEEPQENDIVVVKRTVIGYMFGDEATTVEYDRIDADAVVEQDPWSEYVKDCRIEKWCYETDLERA